jgi:fumarylacetoacetase
VADSAEAGSVYGATRQLDFELELGAFVGPGSALGEPIRMRDAEGHIFGLVLLNDWSARDIQKWEYVPLGPFGAKNFCTSISPWVVTLDALEPFRCATSAGEQREPLPLPYLRDPEYGSYDIKLEVALRPAAAGAAQATTICRTKFSCLFWNIKQQLVHHTVTGCNMAPGDLLGSGTISGATPDSFGSMLELAWRGTKPLTLPDGSQRSFLQDGDEVIMRGWCERAGAPRVGFGVCTGTVLPATPYVEEGGGGGGSEALKS